MSVAHRFAIKLEQCFLSRINTNDQPITFLATESPFLMMRIISTSSLSSHDRHICRHPSWRTVHLALGSVWKHSRLESGLKLTETSEWGRAATNWVGRRIFSPSITSLTPPPPTQPLTLLNIHISTLCPPLYPFIFSPTFIPPPLACPTFAEYILIPQYHYFILCPPVPSTLNVLSYFTHLAKSGTAKVHGSWFFLRLCFFCIALSIAYTLVCSTSWRGPRCRWESDMGAAQAAAHDLCP